MKFNNIRLLVTLFILLINQVENESIDLGGDGTQYIKINYLNDTGDSTLHIDFIAHINQELEFFRNTAAICFKKNNNATDVQVGDPGFGIMFSCYLQGGCSESTELSVMLFSSHLASLNPPTWARGAIDFSNLNTGSLNVGNATDFETTYKLSPDIAANLTIPLTPKMSQWRCYFNFDANEKSAIFLLPIDLSDWVTDITWNACFAISTGIFKVSLNKSIICGCDSR